MPRKRKGRYKGGQRGSTQLPAHGVELEKFSQSDLRTWQRHAENLERYHVQLFYHLAGLRALVYGQLAHALANAGTTELSLDKWVRIIDYKYSLQPLSATGSLLHSGRFNIGRDLDPLAFPVFAAVYLAENFDTAYEERFGLPGSKRAKIQAHELALRRPGSFTSVNVSGRVLNLFNLRTTRCLSEFTNLISAFQVPDALKQLARSLGIQGPLLARTALQVKKSLLAKDWRLYPSQYGIPANPQVFGRLLLDAGFDGVIYPSTKGPRNCVALFPDNFARSESFVEVIDEGPRYSGSLRLDASTWRDIVSPPGTV